MGMSSPKTKAEAKAEIARLQGRIAREKAFLANYIASNKNVPKDRRGYIESQIGNMRLRIADLQQQIANIKAKMSSLPK